MGHGILQKTSLMSIAILRHTKRIKMSDITIKSLGTLIDELITTNIKCWFAQETIMKSNDEAEIAKAAKAAQALNKRRCLLIQSIDKLTGESFSMTDKSY